jgi:hypothetical protein
VNSRKLKCAVVCAEQLMQSASESPKRERERERERESVCVCVWATREVTLLRTEGRDIVSVTASIHSGRE